MDVLAKSQNVEKFSAKRLDLFIMKKVICKNAVKWDFLHISRVDPKERCLIFHHF